MYDYTHFIPLTYPCFSREIFTFDRWITLSVKGELRSARAEDSPDPGGPRCHLTRLAKQQAPVQLDGDEQHTESASSIFVRTEVFPRH